MKLLLLLIKKISCKLIIQVWIVFAITLSVNADAHNRVPINLLQYSTVSAYRLYFNSPLSNTIAYNNNQDMGFTMIPNYSGKIVLRREMNDISDLSPAVNNPNQRFDNFAVQNTFGFDLHSYSFNIYDTLKVGSTIGSVHAYKTDNSVVTYKIVSGNTNGSFMIDINKGSLRVAKILNHHTLSGYQLIVVAYAKKETDTARINIAISAGQPYPNYTIVNWTSTVSQPYKVSEAQGEVVNGKLYSFGGFDSQKSTFTPTKRAYVYDPVANTWTRISDLPYTPTGTNFGGVTHAGITNDGTDIYFAGGYTSNAAGTGQIFGTKQVWKYSVASNTYKRLPDLPIAIAAGQLEYLNGQLHHISGVNTARTQDLGNHYVLDLTNLAAGWKTLATLPNPRQHAGSAVFEGKIYFLGGQHGQDAKLVTLKDVHRYDPQTNSWAKMADLLAPANHGLGHISSAVVVMGERIIVMGGLAVHQTLQTKMVSAYNPSTNNWVSLTDMPAARYSGVAGVLNGKLYYTGGAKTNTTFNGTPVVNSTAMLRSKNSSPVNFVPAGRLIIFPNPAYNSVVNLKLENLGKNERVNISVINLMGKVIKTFSCYTDGKGETTAIIEQQFIRERGAYLIQANALSGHYITKLVIN